MKLVIGANLVGLCAAVGVFVWATQFKPSYLEYPETFTVLAPQVRAGEVVPLLVTRCNASDEEQFYNVSHEVVGEDGRVFVMPTEHDIRIAPGCRTAQSNINRVPPGTPPGRYYVRGRGHTDMGTRVVRVPWQSGWFEVVP